MNGVAEPPAVDVAADSEREKYDWRPELTKTDEGDDILVR